MKYSTIAVFLSSFARTNAEEVSSVQQDLPRPKLLQDVYGSPDSLVKSPGKVNRAIRRPEYFSTRTADNCTFPLDVVILQDNTGSFADDYDQMRDVQLKLMTDALATEHPGTRFALVPFRDKPIGTLGEAYDYCHRYDVLLSDVGLDELDAAYAKLWSNGGKDPAENQFGAMIAALESEKLGWGGLDSIATKLIVVSTDSWPHFAADGLNTYGMAEYSGHLEADEEAQCSEQYYPSPQQVQSVLADSGAYAAFLVFDGNYAGGQVENSWKWFNDYIGQPEDFLERLANDSSNFWEVLSKVIQTIQDEQCGSITSPEPTMSPAGSTQVPPVTEPSAETQPECEGEGCPCPEVLIQLRHKPSRMSLTVENV